MKLQSPEEVEKMVVATLELEKMLPEGYELEDNYSPAGVAAHTIYSMAHRIRDLEAETARLTQQLEEARATTDSVKAGMSMAISEQQRRAETAEADLAKFRRCEPLVFPKTLPDGECGYYGSETVHDRAVYHKEK